MSAAAVRLSPQETSWAGPVTLPLDDHFARWVASSEHEDTLLPNILIVLCWFHVYKQMGECLSKGYVYDIQVWYAFDMMFAFFSIYSSRICPWDHSQGMLSKPEWVVEDIGSCFYCLATIIDADLISPWNFHIKRLTLFQPSKRRNLSVRSRLNGQGSYLAVILAWVGPKDDNHEQRKYRHPDIVGFHGMNYHKHFKMHSRERTNLPLEWFIRDRSRRRIRLTSRTCRNWLNSGSCNAGDIGW